MMKDGRIFQEGTHEKMMEDKSGEYYSLIKFVCKTSESEEYKEPGK